MISFKKNNIKSIKLLSKMEGRCVVMCLFISREISHWLILVSKWDGMAHIWIWYQSRLMAL